MALIFLSPIHRATRQFSLYLQGPCEALGIRSQEGHLLSYLRSYAPSPLPAVLRVFGLKRSTMTSLLDRMEARDLIERRVDPGDRRSFIVDLTPNGRRLADGAQHLVVELEDRIKAKLKQSDIEGFNTVMEAIGQVTDVEVRPDARLKEKA